ncbi:hypothetical protein [Pandoraea oxalativorans]|uniref:Uncharacterized protein n=1 Tax=Pandoraea oxalativorans TaxID=573737 RepID=A0A0G3IHE0_9BURK|nr:hypothetical protein [Pandoraea oxalativorans]AKK24580.1 hypothetical protein MB84_27365 [Pandoraea oxalativorans]
MSIDTTAQVLLDDGEFFVQHNINYPATAGNGFLMRRRHASRLTSETAECVGGYDLRFDGKWHASISTPYNEQTDSDCRQLRGFNDRLAAMHALWKHRHEAATHPGAND